MKKLSTLLIGFALLCHGLPASAEDVTLNFSDADLVAVINSQGQDQRGVVQAAERRRSL
jgi:hypothetical protein